ncbi:MAG: serine hydrolase [bacterium]|nr:serine hydrolase [bacterium]
MNNQLFQDKVEWKFLGSIIVLVFVILVISMTVGNRVKEESVSLETVVKPSPFDGIELAAQAGYALDVRTGSALFARNEDERLPLASLVKVMAALVAVEIAPPESEVMVSAEALKEMGDSGLRAGERWSLKKLLDFTLAGSSNDGMKTVALALGALTKSDATPSEAVSDFVKRMNLKAEAIGMQNTYFWNVTGLDLPAEAENDTAKGGAYGTARDMATLFDYVLRNRPELLEATRENEFSVISLDDHKLLAKNTGRSITDVVPGLKASKTGFTDLAGGNLVIAFDPEVGRPIIIVVLGSTEEERFSDILTLVKATMEHINEN